MIKIWTLCWPSLYGYSYVSLPQCLKRGVIFTVTHKITFVVWLKIASCRIYSIPSTIQLWSAILVDTVQEGIQYYFLVAPSDWRSQMPSRRRVLRYRLCIANVAALPSTVRVCYGTPLGQAYLLRLDYFQSRLPTAVIPGVHVHKLYFIL